MDGSVRTGDDDTEGSQPQSLQCAYGTGGIIDRNTGVGECIADLVSDGIIGSDDEDPAHDGGLQEWNRFAKDTGTAIYAFRRMRGR
jgi:hypothetical protein